MIKKIELLSPAGSLEKLKYAIAYGADGVYAGIPRFSLRARENEFTDKNIDQAVSYCHKSGKKIFLTLNIFPHNKKIDSFHSILHRVNDLRPDAIILADPGIIMLAKKICPDIPIHLSTQANTVNWCSVKFWKDLGIHRVILSRELSIKEIKEIRDKVPDIELEAFVHGSICIAYSGRCLISNYFNYRDPNQGTCTNSCRWQYQLYQRQAGNDQNEEEYYLEESERSGEFLPINEDEHGTYLMNSKDLCAIKLLGELVEAGIDSFKIEGRTKSVYYLSIITRAYRKALDDIYNNKDFDHVLLKEINAVANRGYITGFLDRKASGNIINYKDNEEDGLLFKFCGLIREFNKKKRMAKISVKNRFAKNDHMEIVTPDKIYPFIIEKILSEDGKPLNIAHGGGEDVFINIPEITNKYSIIRKVVKTEV